MTEYVRTTRTKRFSTVEVTTFAGKAGTPLTKNVTAFHLEDEKAIHRYAVGVVTAALPGEIRLSEIRPDGFGWEIQRTTNQQFEILVKTRKLGATDSQGERISARCNDEMAVIGYPYHLDPQDAHKLAASQLTGFPTNCFQLEKVTDRGYHFSANRWTYKQDPPTIITYDERDHDELEVLDDLNYSSTAVVIWHKKDGSKVKAEITRVDDPTEEPEAPEGVTMTRWRDSYDGMRNTKDPRVEEVLERVSWCQRCYTHVVVKQAGEFWKMASSCDWHLPTLKPTITPEGFMKRYLGIFHDADCALVKFSDYTEWAEFFLVWEGEADEALARGFFKEWSDWATGDVFGIQIETLEKGGDMDTDWEPEDSCYGFVGKEFTVSQIWELLGATPDMFSKDEVDAVGSIL